MARGTPRRPEALRAWLAKGPSFDELREAFPAEWEAVEGELGALVGRADTAAVQGYVAGLSAGGGRARGSQADLVRREARRQLAVAALRRHGVAVASGVTSGTARFNLLNGWLAQRLFFERALVRKPVPMRWFRIVWPLVWQRRLLMPLVQPRGIYCFYSRPLVAALAELIDGRPAVEIAAGDGSLSRFLRGRGVEITATDDMSWQGSIDYPEDVVREDAAETLRRRRPEVVLCSWPPAGNAFERRVFAMPTVQLYVVIGSVHRFGFGDWKAYEAQTAFECEERPDLGRLVLPPEVEPAVYVFRRRDVRATSR